MWKIKSVCVNSYYVPYVAELLPEENFGIKIITKGGMVGDDDAANRCITYLKEKLYM